MNEYQQKVQGAYEERDQLRKGLIEIEATLAAGALLADDDEPEGAVTLTISATLARDWIEAISKSRRYL